MVAAVVHRDPAREKKKITLAVEIAVLHRDSTIVTDIFTAHPARKLQQVPALPVPRTIRRAFIHFMLLRAKRVLTLLVPRPIASLPHIPRVATHAHTSHKAHHKSRKPQSVFPPYLS